MIADENELLKIAEKTAKKSGTSIWYEERFYLACNPDGIVRNDSGYEVVEIKYSNVCEDYLKTL